MSRQSLGSPLYGTGNLYAWGENQIIKLYGEGAPAGWVERMGRIDRALHAAGLPVPEAGETVCLGDQIGLVYERIEGGSLAAALLGPPVADLETAGRLARIQAEVHAEIHACGPIPEVPPQRDMLHMIIDRAEVLPAEQKQAVLRALDAMTEGDRLCHGDFHPFNVLLGPYGPVVIDWNNAHVGDPLEDVARSELILREFAVSVPVYRAQIERFTEAYLERYFALRPSGQQRLAAWRPIVAAARLGETGAEVPVEWLVAQVRGGLEPSQ
jgi:aminoglycoside phosphotransferase (APT) family kinase protein